MLRRKRGAGIKKRCAGPMCGATPQTLEEKRISDRKTIRVVNRQKDEEARLIFEAGQERRRNLIKHAPPKSNCWRSSGGSKICGRNHSIWATPEEFAENLLEGTIDGIGALSTGLALASLGGLPLGLPILATLAVTGAAKGITIQKKLGGLGPGATSSLDPKTRKKIMGGLEDIGEALKVPFEEENLKRDLIFG